MNTLSAQIAKKTSRPIRIVQFGEGNFLRAFIDWFIQIINESTDFNGNVTVVQPLPSGRVKELEKQDGLYTLILEGIENGQLVRSSRIIDVLDQFIDPYSEYESFLKLAENPDLKLILSNTTEAGISYLAADGKETGCPASFPGKLLQLLKRRYDHFKGSEEAGLYILACELIDHNGDELKSCLLKLSDDLDYPASFKTWLENANLFYNTLVDRIVPGYPREQVEELREKFGYIDNNMVKGEIFHLWVIEGDPKLTEVFPVDQADLNIILTQDVRPYKERKVKILNGAHTSMVPIAYQLGKRLVSEMMNDTLCRHFLDDFMKEEVWPTIDLSQDECQAFTESVYERFLNPTIRHELLTISLNSMTKYKTRVLPSAIAIYEHYGKLPRHALFSLASLFHMYSLKKEDGNLLIQDDPQFLELWKELWNGNYDTDAIADRVLSLEHWEYEFPDEWKTFVKPCLKKIHEQGIETALHEVFG